jgi:hypothetical protein
MATSPPRLVMQHYKKIPLHPVLHPRSATLVDQFTITPFLRLCEPAAFFDNGLDTSHR